MKKYFPKLVCLGIVSSFFVLIAILLHFISINSEQKETYPWIREEGYVIDINVSGDCVSFKYALCYSNESDYYIGITHVVCGFDESELDGWYTNTDSRQNNILVGFANKDGSEVYIAPGEERVVVFTFEGSYAGGTIPSELSYPSKIIWGEHVYSSCPDNEES